jgi:PKD repeat protein
MCCGILKKKHRFPLLSVVGALMLVYALLIAVGGQDVAGQGVVRYVKSNGAASGACGSWAAACTLDYAMSQAVAGDELWLMKGVYTPTVGAGPTSSFTLTSGVALYGGFAGTETLRAQRNYTMHEVILTGDIGVPGNTNDNTYHVVTAMNVNANTVVDGVTIRHGNATGSSSATQNGGGMYIYSGDLIVANVIFTSNTAQYGGGLWTRYGAPTLVNAQFHNNQATYGAGAYNRSMVMTLTDGIFFNNAASSQGGGFYNNDGAPVMTNVRFEGNTTGFSGGGFYNDDGAPVMTNVRFENNRAGGTGGGMYSGTGFPRLTATQFISNSANSNGGGAYLYKDTLTLTDSVFMSNTARSHGGALYSYRAAFAGANVSLFSNSARYNGGAVFTDRSAVTLTNVTAAYNQGKYGGVFYNDTTTVTLTNATFYTNLATVDGGAVFNDAAPVMIEHLTAVGNHADHYGGAIYSILDTPTVRNSVLWGNTAEKGAVIIGTATFVETIVEGGCPIGVSCTHVHSEDPLLGAYDNHGGGVNTIPILTGSPAIDHVTTFCPAADARGVARPQGTACDIGAYESRGLALTVVSGDNQAVEVYQPYAAPLVISAISLEGHAVDGAVATFASPTSGAGVSPASKTATFAGGQAAVNVTANGFPGTYAVTVRAPGSQPVIFNLDNLDTPVAGLQAWHSGTAPVGHAVTFTATVQGGTSIVYTWEFGDGATISTTENVLTHAYALAGTYPVAVTAANEIASARVTLPDLTIYDVQLAGLTAASNAPTTLGQPTHFQATTQTGTGLAYIWGFGDGASATGQAPVHTYTAPGSYTATVTATNGVSTGTAQTTVLVEQALAGVGLLPQGAITGEVGRAVAFSIEVGSGQPTTVTWRFGDEPPSGANALAAEAGSAPWASIEHVYAAPGAYQVVAHVANSVSAFDVSNAIEIRDVPISGASIGWNGEAEIGQPLTFTGHHDEGTSVSCIWDFDDATPPVAGCDVEHTYKSEGSFTVKLWIFNSIGVVVARSSIEIIDPTPDPTIDNYLFLPSVYGATMPW